MQTTKAILNRPVFTQRAFDSSALTVLTTLIHRFAEAGTYDLFIRRGEQVVHRAEVHVVREAEAAHQIDVDMARLSADPKGCDCGKRAGYTLREGGVMCFFVSKGISRYSVLVEQIGIKEKRTLLDSAKVIPEGDLFAVTLVLPGAYRALNTVANAEGLVEVAMPAERYRLDQPSIVEVKRTGRFSPHRVGILLGQTVVFRCGTQARIRLELVKPHDIVQKREQEKPRFTRRKSDKGK
jgi:hypothetical protein